MEYSTYICTHTRKQKKYHLSVADTTFFDGIGAHVLIPIPPSPQVWLKMLTEFVRPMIV